MTALGYMELKIGDHVIIGGKNLDAGSECIVISKTNHRACLEKVNGSEFAMPNNCDSKDSLSSDQKQRYVSYTILRKIGDYSTKSQKPLFTLIVYEELYGASNNYEYVTFVKGIFSSREKAEEAVKKGCYNSYEIKEFMLDKFEK